MLIPFEGLIFISLFLAIFRLILDYFYLLSKIDILICKSFIPLYNSSVADTLNVKLYSLASAVVRGVSRVEAACKGEDAARKDVRLASEQAARDREECGSERDGDAHLCCGDSVVFWPEGERTR
jgi:hypothetical protein